MQSQTICSKHNQPIIYICSMQTCIKNKHICQLCKMQDGAHFGHHANYIYRIKQLFEFDNSKLVIPRLEKGIQDCQSHIALHKKFYQQEMNTLKEDFKNIRDQFFQVSQNFQKVYTQQFIKEMNKFDQRVTLIKSILRDYTKEKASQQSFFNSLFGNQAPSKSVDDVLLKNSKAFKVRADIMELKQNINQVKQSTPKYKATNTQQAKFNQLKTNFTDFLLNFYSKFKDFISSSGKSRNNSLKESIATETRSLTMSRVGSPRNLSTDLHASMVSQHSLQKASIPDPHPAVIQVLNTIRPLPVLKTDKRDQGPYRYPSGVYFGHYEGSIRQGRGIFYYNDGSYYQGSWENDNMSGYGRLIKPNCYYEGDIKDGKAHGKGNYEDINRTYAGEWKDDCRHGLGEQQFKTGKKKKYVGMFVQDKYQGKGKLFQEDYIYEGNFKQGFFHGQNCLVKYKNGQIFHGFFDLGFKRFGRHTFIDGNYYQGTFKNNLPNGPGDFVWTDGIIYSGQWKDGVQDGVGIMNFPDGRKLTGIWHNGNWLKWK